MSKKIAILFIFTSETNALKTYQTLQYVDRSMSCDCPGWTFKKKTTASGDRTCKHTRAIEAGIGKMSASNVVEYCPLEDLQQTLRAPHAKVTTPARDYEDHKPRRAFDL